jgi:NAD(P)-dependent dehydrogenase (short-subunit alcohol dehydrogenase family)
VEGEPAGLDPHAMAVQADLMDPTRGGGRGARWPRPSRPPLRAVVNLVGGFAAGGRVHETPVETFEAQLRLNLRPTYLVTAAVLPYLLEAGGGSVVCISTRAAVKPFSGAAGYITSKVALLGLVDALAAEYRDDRNPRQRAAAQRHRHPGQPGRQPDADFSKWVPPEQIADAIAFLCSRRLGGHVGAHIPVYGRA